MDNILNFPSKSIQDWQAIKKTIKQYLESAGESEALMKKVLERMKPVIEEFSYEFEIPSNLSPDLIIELQKHTSKLIHSRLVVEIELAKALGY